ncbi:hypothetical protein UFOVP221_86 [uncultured Caudovirales phage]|uniref:Major tropism determinant N-terminal domain-containing protein n=1 Tax=uncultured Caudovirales phage TaxID=2100421 RepID=A0A6J7WWP2_9CAUD|nr:hypothetical protein UFOVP221_86 [uncultured Caudovirales phage]
MARNQKIQVRRDVAAAWTSSTQVLESGEIGFETDTGKFKIGTGALWSATDYTPAGLTYSSGTNAVVNRATNIAGGLAGSLPYQSALNTTTTLGIGTANKILAVNSGANAPEWITPTVSSTYFGTASTTSTQLAGVLSDETGYAAVAPATSTGVAVFNNAPTIITPKITSGLQLAGSVSGNVTLQAKDAAASGTLSFPSATDTVVVLADIAQAAFKTGTSPSQALNLTGVTTITTTSGTITFPTATGGVTLATTTVTDGFLKSDGTFGGGSPSTLSGSLPLGNQKIATSSGNAVFPSLGSGDREITVSGVNQTIAGDKTFSGTTSLGAITQTTGAVSFGGATTISGTATLSNAAVKLSGLASLPGSGTQPLQIGSDGTISVAKITLTSSEDVEGTLPVARGGLGVDPGTTALTFSPASPLATARSVLRVFVQSTQPASGNPTGYTPALGDLWFW